MDFLFTSVLIQAQTLVWTEITSILRSSVDQASHSVVWKYIYATFYHLLLLVQTPSCPVLLKKCRDHVTEHVSLFKTPHVEPLTPRVYRPLFSFAAFVKLVWSSCRSQDLPRCFTLKKAFHQLKGHNPSLPVPGLSLIINTESCCGYDSSLTMIQINYFINNKSRVEED